MRRRRALALLAWLVVWQLASASVGSRLLLAGPVETLACLAHLVGLPAFWAAVGFSLVRVVGGFCAAFALALLAAPLARRSPVVAEFVSLGLGAVKSVPVVCVVVLLLMLVGSRNVSAVAVFLVALPALYFSCLEALDNLDPGMDELLDACGEGGMRRVLGHVWPSVHPFLVATCRNAIGMSWKAGVAAELIGMPMGSIGERVYQTKLLLETGDLFAWTIVVVALAALSERAFLALLQGSVDLGVRLATRCVQRGRVPDAMPAPAALAMHDASVSFGGAMVVPKVSLELPAGGRLVLGDPSGTGKTTFLRLVAGTLGPSSGTVAVEPRGPRAVSLMTQAPHLLEGVSAVGNVAFLAGEWADEDRIREMLLELLDEGDIDRPVRELSGGQRRRVELVRTLARPSGMVLLDEPFASLDAAGTERAAAFVGRHLGGRTLVVASHVAGTARLLDARPATLPKLAGGRS